MGDPVKNSITHEIKGTVFDTIRSAGQHADHILIGDTDHSDIETRQFLSSPELIRSLAEAGATHLCVEVPEMKSELAEQYMAGKITRDDFISAFESSISLANTGEVSEHDMAVSIADTIDHAQAVQMQIHFVDPSSNAIPILSTPVSQEIFDRAIEHYETSHGFEPGSIQTIQNANYALADYAREGHMTPDMYKQLFTEILMNSRYSDGQLAEYVERVTDGEKAAVIYGAGHDDIASQLGGNVLVVDAYNNHNVNIDYDPSNPAPPVFTPINWYETVNNADSPGRTPAGEPDVVHILGGGTYMTDQADPSMFEGIEMTPSTGPEFPPTEPLPPPAGRPVLPSSLPRPPQSI